MRWEGILETWKYFATVFSCFPNVFEIDFAAFEDFEDWYDANKKILVYLKISLIQRFFKICSFSNFERFRIFEHYSYNLFIQGFISQFMSQIEKKHLKCFQIIFKLFFFSSRWKLLVFWRAVGSSEDSHRSAKIGIFNPKLNNK